MFASTTVLLETEWVLRSVYGLEATALATALRAFAGLPHVAVQEPASVAQALDWMEGGLDFADALHLAQTGGCDAFVTFDRQFAGAANGLRAVKVRAWQAFPDGARLLALSPIPPVTKPASAGS